MESYAIPIDWLSSSDARVSAAHARSDLPLAGLRVVSLSRVIAGPIAARFLAALGAEVIQIDPPRAPEIETQHLDTNPGVRVHAVDLRTPQGVQAVHNLLSAADALITGYRPHSLDALGLGEEALASVHPHLVVSRLQAWDPVGPWAKERGFHSIVQAASVISVLFGTNGSVGALPVQALDPTTGFAVAASILERLSVDQAGTTLFELADAASRLLAGAKEGTEPAAGDPLLWEHELRTTDQYAGTLTYVPPPVAVNGERLDCGAPPAAVSGDLPN